MTSENSPATHPALDAEYEILRELGRGGTALVYLARERASGNEVAIKVIRSRYIDDEEAQARFAREAQVVAQLNHPNVVHVRAVVDLGRSGLAIVMDHVVGHTLKERIKEGGPLAPDDAAQIVREIGSALEAAHAAGIVHRDVKPENIFIDADGRAMLADFGLARSMTPDSSLTMAGVALGTPAYMAPEQIDGNDLDGRVDVYSLGLVAWEMLIGRRAWNGEGLYAILYHQKHELPPDVRELRDDVPDRLAEVIARAIEKKRDARWASIRDMLAALDESTPLTLAPRAVGGGGETIRFVRPSLPTIATVATVATVTTIPPDERMLALEQLASGSHAIEVPRRRLPVVAKRTATVAATLSVAALAVFFMRRPTVSPSTKADQKMTPVLQGVASAPMTVPTSPDPHALRPDSTRALTTAAAATATPTVTAAPAPAGSADTAVQQPAVVIPALRARPKIAIASLPSEKPAQSDPSAISVWGGPPALKLGASVAAGGTHSCLVSAAGKATCWGANDHGQLGDLSADRAKSVVTLDVQQQLVAIVAGASHTCAIARDGAAMCWGNNDHGQSGVRSFGPKVAPSVIRDSHVFWSIAAGDAHTCAVDEFGLPWCWGSNAHGQLGETSVAETAAPILSGKGAMRFASIVAGSNFTCALTSNGRVSCWGENGSGQLGDGSNFDRPLPVSVTSVAFTSIAAGSSHTCGLTADGEAYCWGRNASGQLGDGGTVDRNSPVRVRGGARFKSITAGANHTCAVAVDGTGYCWGQNTFGQLGTGGAADVAQPATVADGHVFASIRAFGSHTCGLTTGGEAFCWGNNAESQLGDGTQAHRSRPTAVAGVRER